MVHERLRFSNRPTNYAVAKTELLKKRDIAQQSGDQEVNILENTEIIYELFEIFYVYNFIHIKLLRIIWYLHRYFRVMIL